MNYTSLHGLAMPGGFRAQFEPGGPGIGYNAQEHAWHLGFEMVCERTPLPRCCRVYVPPGAIRVVTQFYIAEGLQIGVVARFRNQPDGDYSKLTLGNFSQFAWKNIGKYGETPGRLVDVMSDFPARPFGGHIIPVGGYIRSPLDDGGWLYLLILDLDPKGNIFKFQYFVDVGEVAWAKWIAKVRWDGNGDPSDSVAPPPAPDPEPMPTPAPGTIVVTRGANSITVAWPAGMKVEMK